MIVLLNFLRSCVVSLESSRCLNRLMNYYPTIADIHFFSWSIVEGSLQLAVRLNFDFVDPFCYILFSQTFWVFYTFQRKTKKHMFKWCNCKHMKFVKLNYSFLAEGFRQVFFKMPKLPQLQENIYIFTKLLQMPPRSLIFGCKFLLTHIFCPFYHWKRHLNLLQISSKLDDKF